MAELIVFDDQQRVERGDGITSVRLTPHPLEDQGFTVGVTTFPPGTSIRLHSHNCIEQVTMLEGEGIVVLNGEEREVKPYDTTQVPAGDFHRFINRGDGQMRILWVYGAIDVTRTFADTGETVPQFHNPAS